MSLNVDSVVLRESEPVAARVDGDIVMLSERAGAYFGLNGVGSEIWELIARPRRIGDICRSLSEVYDIDEKGLLQKVTAFLEQLLRHGLVRTVDGADG
jgi:hypothetical protein